MPPDIAGQRSKMDEAMPPDVAVQRSQADESLQKSQLGVIPKGNTSEQQEYNLCSHRWVGINHLLERRILKEKFNQK